MSRNTVALVSPSRNVRIRPGCSSTYQRPSGAWNAPVIELNVRPHIARTRLTCGIVVATVGAGVGAVVGDGVGEGEAVGLAVGVGVGVGLGLGVAVARGVEAAASGVGDADGAATGVAVHAHASTRTTTSASRRAPTTFTVSTLRRPYRCDPPRRSQSGDKMMGMKAMNKLTPEETRVIVNKGTERPFTGAYDDFFVEGTYVCRRCETPLYVS